MAAKEIGIQVRLAGSGWLYGYCALLKYRSISIIAIKSDCRRIAVFRAEYDVNAPGIARNHQLQMQYFFGFIQ